MVGSACDIKSMKRDNKRKRGYFDHSQGKCFIVDPL